MPVNGIDELLINKRQADRQAVASWRMILRLLLISRRQSAPARRREHAYAEYSQARCCYDARALTDVNNDMNGFLQAAHHIGHQHALA